MGHWEQIGTENRKERERRAKLPRWRRELGRHADGLPIIAGWLALAAIVLWVIGLL